MLQVLQRPVELLRYVRPSALQLDMHRLPCKYSGDGTASAVLDGFRHDRQLDDDGPLQSKQDASQAPHVYAVIFL